MMGLATFLKGLAATAVALGTIGGTALAVDKLYVDQGTYDKHVSSNRVQTILSLASESEREGGPDYLCRALHAEFAALCTEQPGHYFCEDPATKQEILFRADCT